VKPLTKSIIITSTGYVIGLIAQFIVYPLFGLVVSLSSILSLGIIFTVIAFCGNYISLKLIELYERKLNAKTI